MITVQVTHKCSHSVTLEVKGPREARQYQNWLATLPCPKCKEKQDAHDAIVALVQMGVEKITENVFSAPSQTEDQHHILTTDSEGHVNFCTCKWFKNDGFKLHPCVHAEAVERYIVEAMQTVPAAA